MPNISRKKLHRLIPFWFIQTRELLFLSQSLRTWHVVIYSGLTQHSGMLNLTDKNSRTFPGLSKRLPQPSQSPLTFKHKEINVLQKTSARLGYTLFILNSSTIQDLSRPLSLISRTFQGTENPGENPALSRNCGNLVQSIVWEVNAETHVNTVCKWCWELLSLTSSQSCRTDVKSPLIHDRCSGVWCQWSNWRGFRPE